MSMNVQDDLNMMTERVILQSVTVHFTGIIMLLIDKVIGVELMKISVISCIL